jgi:hypothetical protein
MSIISNPAGCNVSFKDFYQNLSKQSKKHDPPEKLDKFIVNIIKDNLSIIKQMDNPQNLAFGSDGRITLIAASDKGLNVRENLEIFTKFTKNYFKKHIIDEPETRQIQPALLAAADNLNQFDKSQLPFTKKLTESSFTNLQKASEYVVLNEKMEKISLSKKEISPAEEIITKKFNERQKDAQELKKKLSKTNKTAKRLKIAGAVISVISGILLIPFTILFPPFLAIVAICLTGTAWLLGTGLLNYGGLTLSSRGKEYQTKYQTVLNQLINLNKLKALYDDSQFLDFLKKNPQYSDLTKVNEWDNLRAIYSKIKEIEILEKKIGMADIKSVDLNLQIAQLQKDIETLKEELNN